MHERPPFKIDTFFEKMMPAALLLGGLLRIVIWLQNRSLFIDEANLARNLAEKNYADLFQKLDYNQYCPPLFACFEKLSFSIFGVTELAGRALPVAASLAALWLFFQLSRRWIASPVARFWAAVFFAFSPVFLRYGTELKQYSTDIFTTLFLIWMALRKPVSGQFSWQRAFGWALGGAVVVWFSMPSIFMLAAVWVYFFVENRRANRTASIFKIDFKPLIFIALCWLSSFAAYYFLILKNDINDSVLRSAHVFFQFPPKNLNELRLLGEQIFMFRTALVGITAISTLIFFGALAGGIFSIFQSGSRFWKFEKFPKSDLLLPTLPILFCLTASAAGFYSVAERLTLFFMPLLLLLLAAGWQFFLKKNQLTYWLSIVLLTVAAAGHVKPEHFWKPFHVEEIRAGLEFVEQKMSMDDCVYTHLDVNEVQQFYQKAAAKPIIFKCLQSGGDTKQDFEKLKNHPPSEVVWLVLDTTWPLPGPDFFGENFEVEQSFVFARGEVWRLKKKNAGR